MSKYRYLADFDTDKLEKEYYDVVVVGSGIAGVYTSLVIPEKYNIAILTKETIEISNSVLAQGGIAVSLDKEDSPELHFKDTIFAGDGLCDEKSVWVLVKEAAENIENLCRYGVNFDRQKKGELSLSREAAHSKNRIIHVRDATGREVCDKLICEVEKKNNVDIKERICAADLLTENNECRGILAYDEDTKRFKIYYTSRVICATGGYGQLYAFTTNPEVATGDGACMALRAGAPLMDLEFVQFHPTVLYHDRNRTFLISEAVRGEGAVLRNKDGERFMHKYHELKELAPRDVVSRAIFKEMKKTDSECVYLDITFKSRNFLQNRYPTIYKKCMEYGLDMSQDYIPVAPAEHYSMGGIKTDIFGRTGIKGFYACGEAACNGIHGANRLASNSLLEGLVFGSRIGSEIEGNMGKKHHSFSLKYKTDRKAVDIDSKSIKSNIQKIMTEYVGIIRDEKGLYYAKREIDKYAKIVENMKNRTIEDFQVQNMVTMARLIIKSAIERKESRGAHYRLDYRNRNDKKWNKHIIRKKEKK